ncbi:MAG: NB-ARC domain-containing protein [Rubrivivax sp.]
MTPAPASPWRLRLLGAVALADAAGAPRRLPGRPATLLLARLALAPQQDLPREHAIELLWPGVAPEVGRNRLRQMLSVLKRELEPDGRPVLQADRHALRLLPGTLVSDVGELESLWRAGRRAEARERGASELMPGYYEEWVQEERRRLETLLEADPRAAPLPAGVDRAAPPAYATPAFGLDGLRATLAQQLRARRLITLLGMGGAGKTRLAVEVAQALRQAADSPFDRVAWVPLAACTATHAVLDALGDALAGRGGVDDPLDRVVHSLAGRRVLLVLDNFEQLPEDAAAVPAALLARLPALHLLVTSRRPLGLDAEWQFRVPALALPPEGARVGAALATPALALFLERARAAGAALELTPRNLAPLRALMASLDGLPLAIELAAARARTLSVAELTQEMAAAHPRPARRATLDASLDWSWRLLGAEAQQALAALSLFEAPFTARQAQWLVGEGPAVSLLQGLSDHSLLRTLPRDADGLAPVRFELPQAVREYAAGRLPPPLRERLHAQLRAGLVAWAEALPLTLTPREAEPSLPHVRALLARAAAPGEGEAAWRVALAMRRLWESDMLPLAGIQALETALPAAPPARRSEALDLLAYLRFSAGFPAVALAHAEAALAAALDAALRARALVRRLWVRVAAADDAAPFAGQVEEALAAARASGDLEAEARALHQQAVLLHPQPGGAALAEACFEHAQQLWERAGDHRRAMAQLAHRGQCWLGTHRTREALAAFEACEALAREEGDWLALIVAAQSRANALTHLRRWAESLAALQLALEVAWRREHLHALAWSLWGLGRPLARLCRPREAMRLMAFCEAYWRRHYGVPAPERQREVRRVRGLVARLASPLQAQGWEIEGRALELAAAVRLALEQGPAP